MKLPTSWPAYLSAAVVLIVSFGATIFLPIPDAFRGIVTLPGVGAMLGVLVQLWRDVQAHERKKELQESSQAFTLSVASHMSNITFDKHVAFCEAYFAKINEGMQKLSGTGPRENALELANDLHDLRRTYAPWLTKEIEDRLVPLEHSLRQIGAASKVLDYAPVGDERTQLVHQMYDTFAIVMGVKEGATDEQRETAASTIFEHLRSILGTRALTELRIKALRAAAERADSALKG